jgi:hypothetical protein
VLVLGVLLLASILTLAASAYVLLATPQVQKLLSLQAPAPATWPRLSVVIPALNEVDTLEAALGTLLAETYPDLEIVLVDDRSTDGTGALVDRLAARDPRITPVHVTALPEGWLGKVHALHVGTQHARGDWLLYTDADVHFGQGSLRHAVAVAEAQQLDHLAVLPRLLATDYLLRAMLASFAMLFILMAKPHRVGQPGSRAFAGVGAFNLVRRSVFARTPGFEWLRMEVGDDMGLGYMLQQVGARGRFLDGAELLSITWYPDARSMVRGLEKNTYAILSRFSVLRFLVAVPLLVWFATGAPLLVLLGLLGYAPPALTAVGLAAVLAQVVTHARSAQRHGFGLWPGLATYAAGTLMLVALLASAWSCLSRGGITWRGTLYPTALLRAGQRLKL